jgi:pyruvate-formate lyase-activating enzyme
MIQNFDALEPAIDPNNRIGFLLDWELTMKCNLDCSYCSTDLYGGHDNSTKHPPLDQCLDSLRFMFEYVDQYMKTKPKGTRYVVLNVYGGESLYHPDIVEILTQVRKQYVQYQDRWHLTVTTTTNAIISDNLLQSIIPCIDEFTVSYHTEHTTKQRQQFKNNLQVISSSGKRIKCIVLMHSDPKLFEDATGMIEWLEENNIQYLPRQLDHRIEKTQFNYSQNQVIWFDKLYSNQSYNTKEQIVDAVVDQNNHIDLSDTGRACCGGRQLCKDGNRKLRDFFVENKFPNWYCSVNHFFLYIKQVTGEVFVNKDCMMNFNGEVGPIGYLNNTDQILINLQNQLDTKTLPVIQCKKYRCLCGLCAPKAKNLETYKKIMNKYQKENTSCDI